MLRVGPRRTHGLLLGRGGDDHAGRRERTVYSITPAGRAALREWLATDPKRVSLEFEGMIHVLLADQGTIEDLRSTLESVREEALLSRAVFESRVQYIRKTDGGTFPEKRHFFALSSAFMFGHFTHLADWATWALGEIEGWTDTQAPRADA